MTADVVSIGPDAPRREVARLLAARGISAVPVIDATGAPIGMISEGDLIGRNDGDRRARRDWWLTLLAEGEDLHPDFLASLREPDEAVRPLMSTPVVTAGEDDEIADIARLLVSHHIKRVPVLRNGRVVGIVSRADLVKAMAADDAARAASPPHRGLLAGAIDDLEARFCHRQSRRPLSAVAEALLVAPDDGNLTAADFRALVTERDRREAEHRSVAERALADERRRRVAVLVDQHISDGAWRQLVHQARIAAERGEVEFMLLRFPSTLCSDDGRAINAAESGWPGTLRGEAAELYLRWEHDLRSRGFPITARVLEFPGGMPGDIGLFLDWQPEQSAASS